MQPEFVMKDIQKGNGLRDSHFRLLMQRFDRTENVGYENMKE